MIYAGSAFGRAQRCSQARRWITEILDSDIARLQILGDDAADITARFCNWTKEILHLIVFEDQA